MMKVTVEIDCTPAEARAFFGLPDLEPLQTAVMAKVESRMLEEMDRFSPEALMRSWFTLLPQNAERMQEMFASMFRKAAGGAKTAKS